MSTTSNQISQVRRKIPARLKKNETLTTIKILTSSVSGLAGLTMTVVFFAAAIFSLLTSNALLPYDPFGLNIPLALQPPSWIHWFGTDSLGRDIFSRILAAAPIDAEVAFAVVSVAVLFGVPLGSIAAFKGGIVEEIVMRVTDTFLAFPGLVLAIAIAIALGAGVTNSILALAPVWWPSYVRLARGETLAIKSQDFVEASRASGQKGGFIILHHILPTILPIILAYATLDIGSVLVTFSVLSFIGVGAQPPTPEWGLMAVQDELYFIKAPWVVIIPSIIILLAAIGFSLLGDKLRDAFDPRTRSLFR
jgi:peptide/nickel transport system permease protein